MNVAGPAAVQQLGTPFKITLPARHDVAFPRIGHAAMIAKVKTPADLDVPLVVIPKPVKPGDGKAEVTIKLKRPGDEAKWKAVKGSKMVELAFEGPAGELPGPATIKLE